MNTHFTHPLSDTSSATPTGALHFDGTDHKKILSLGDGAFGLAIWQRKLVLRHIEENMSEVIKVDDLANLARLSCSHFAAAFKVSFGRPPHQYIIGRRLELAKFLMQNTDRPLCHIAIDCGLCDQAHLCTLFRKRFGTTPSRWRRRWRKGDC